MYGIRIQDGGSGAVGCLRAADNARFLPRSLRQITELSHAYYVHTFPHAHHAPTRSQLRRAGDTQMYVHVNCCVVYNSKHLERNGLQSRVFR